MAGGKWSSQNKIRPGAYINFQTSDVEALNISDRGIATLTMPLSWGGEGKIIELTSEDLLNGNSLAKVGLMYDDADLLLPKLALDNCSLLKIFNSNSGGTKATKTLDGSSVYNLTTDTAIDSSKTYYTRSGAGTTESPYVYTAVTTPDVADIATYYEKTDFNGLTITAKHEGTFGNKIAIVITVTNTVYTVETYADGYFVDSQKVASAADLVSNNFVDFTTENVALAEQSSVLLTGGANGNVATNMLTSYFTALKSVLWNTLAMTSTVEADILATKNFITSMRDDEGKYVQAVVANASTSIADYEGLINVANGIVLSDGTSISAAQFTAWVAGATAGARLTESLTGKVIEDAESIVGMLDNEKIINALTEGKFVLSLNQNGTIKVEKDINSFHTFTGSKGYPFSKNRVIRELDQIGTNIEDIWETTYLGKVTNDEAGRTLFKSSIITYLSQIQTEGAISEFDMDSITVIQGSSIDSVVATLAVKPLDSMEFLYLTINIS